MELLLYNGILSLPVLLTIILTTGEIWKAMEGMQAQCAQNVWFLPLLISSLLMGSLLNYCLFLCTLCNSALTTTIVGTLRSVLATVCTFFFQGYTSFVPSISCCLLHQLVMVNKLQQFTSCLSKCNRYFRLFSHFLCVCVCVCCRLLASLCLEASKVHPPYSWV